MKELFLYPFGNIRFGGKFCDLCVVKKSGRLFTCR